MDIKEVQTIIKTFKEAELDLLSLKCEDFELQLEQGRKQGEVQSPSLPNHLEVPQTVVTETKKKVITSPMVGTFYAAADPKAQPMVEVGSYVKKGEVVCIIEAMKLMNEVEAECEGEIAEVLVANEEMVEYGQPLFTLK